MPEETLYGLTEGQVRRLGRVLNWYEREGKHLSARPSENAPPGDPIPMELARPTRTVSSTLPSTATLPLRYHKVDSTGGTVPDTGSTVQGHDMAAGGASVFDRHAVSRHWQSGRQYAHPQRAPCSIVGGELHTMGVTKSSFLAWGAASWTSNSSGTMTARGGGSEVSLLTDPTTYATEKSTDGVWRTVGGAWSLVQDVWVRDWAYLSSTGLVPGRTYRIFIYDSPTTYSTAGSTNWPPVPAGATPGWTSRFRLEAVWGNAATIRLTMWHGALVLKSDRRKRYIGAVTVSTDGKFEDSRKNRLVYNFYNRRFKELGSTIGLGLFGSTEGGGDTARAKTPPLRVTHDFYTSNALHLQFHADIARAGSSNIGTTGALDTLYVLYSDGRLDHLHYAYAPVSASTYATRFPLDLSAHHTVLPTTSNPMFPDTRTYRFTVGAYSNLYRIRSGCVMGLVEC